MKQNYLRQIVRPDTKHQIHIDVPEDFGNEVEVIVRSLHNKPESLNDISPESLAVMRLTDESGFVRNVINSVEEDCWNDL